MIAIQEVITSKHLREFIYFPQTIYSDDSHWVPPIYADEYDFHNPKLNSALQYSEVIRLIAYRDQRAVGRIMGIVNKKYNDQHNEQTARFFQFDCINEGEVARVLINAIENGLRPKE